MPTDITIEYFENNLIQISYPGFNIKAPYSLSMVQQEVKDLIENAHYNEIFSIRETHGMLEGKPDVAAELRKILQSEIDKAPSLNLAIEGYLPENWEARRAGINEKQRTILEKAYMIAERIRSYPLSISEAELQKQIRKASPKDFLDAKTFIEQQPEALKKPNWITKRTSLHPVTILLMPVGALALILGLAFSAPALLFVAAFAILASAALLAQHALEPYFAKRRFNAKTGYSDDFVKETAKLSNEFLNTLRPEPESTVAAPAFAAANVTNEAQPSAPEKREEGKPTNPSKP